MPDHPTPCDIKTHTREPVPFLIAGSDIDANDGARFDEADAATTGLRIGPAELMTLLLKD